jgi:hypothetical protein
MHWPLITITKILKAASDDVHTHAHISFKRNVVTEELFCNFIIETKNMKTNKNQKVVVLHVKYI